MNDAAPDSIEQGRRLIKVTPNAGFAAADTTTLVVTANDGSPAPASAKASR